MDDNLSIIEEELEQLEVSTGECFVTIICGYNDYGLGI